MNWKSYGDALRHHATISRHRFLLLIAGGKSWRVQVAKDILGPVAATWITDRKINGEKTIKSAQAIQLLGQETDSIVYDGDPQIDADALGIVSGTISGGGLLILLTPLAEKFSAYSTSRFHRRLFRILSQTNRKFNIIQGEHTPDLEHLSVQAAVRPEPVTGTEMAATPDQKRAVEAINHVLSGQRKRPAVLVADRGRGKSAALGIAAGQLLVAGKKNILVTGHSRSSVDAVFRHASAITPEASSRLHWIDPDRLIQTMPDCDLLLIDEAASLHLHKLEALLKRYPRIAMATTVHGYEGTGRGFLLRFHTILGDLTRGWKKVQLTTPIRWSIRDPLENLVNELLILDAELPTITDDEHTPDRFRIEKVAIDSVYNHEHVLREIFSLLVLAHYKTRPKDLQHLLDNPDLQLYRFVVDTRSGSITAAVSVLIEEGKLTREQGVAIFKGESRPPGHVLGEILASQLGLPLAATLKMGRIMRIVVHPELRRRGMGSRLIERLCREAQADFDMIGTNFSLSPGLAQFWKRCGFDPVRIGLSRSAEGGSNSAMFLRPFSEKGISIFDGARSSYALNLPDQLKTTLRGAEAAIVRELIRDESLLFRDPDSQVLNAIAGYCFGSRPGESIPAPLNQLATNGLVSGQIGEADLIVERVLQGRPWQQCPALRGDQGRRHGSQRIRHAVVSYLQMVLGDDLEAAFDGIIKDIP